ncbi:MAG: hypothetical protein H0W22_02805 [Chloroflexi bacterium]|nr:hypothetical protein [Chloroflexota bacterium]
MNVIDWLLDSDPAIRWQVMRDLTDEPAHVVAAERARVAHEGWGARFLDHQRADGSWGGGANFPEWTGTKPTLAVLRLLGPLPTDPRVRRAIDLVREHVLWEYDDLPFFDGEVEPCINGSTVAIGSYFGQEVQGIVDRLLTEQMDDGGWNCEQENGSTRGSFDTTINVLEGLLAHERAMGGTSEVKSARLRGEEYLLDRHLLRRLSTGEVIDPAYTRLFFPTRWHYDFLRGLDHLRNAGAVPDERVDEAIELLRSKRDADGRWPIEFTYPGEVHFEMEGGDGQPSRWNTLRAMRVLRWADRAGSRRPDA